MAIHLLLLPSVINFLALAAPHVNLNLASPLMTVKCHRQRLMKFDILIAEEVEEMGSLFFPFEGEGAKGVLKKQGIMMVHSLRNSTCLRLRKNRTDVEC
ncbi:hypothetical protein QQP08_000218 [Theobroma cacao]|nr:hypothetical protein QQP08_000218 [Theobroma cacao]